MRRIATLFCLLAIITACSNNNPTQPKERVTPVETAPIKKDNFVVERELVGRATAAHSSAVIAEKPGELVTLNVSKGDRIKKGETIGVVDPGSGESQIELQQLAVRQAKKQLENAKISERQAEQGVATAESQVELARQADKSQNQQTEQAVQAAKEQYEQAQELADQTKRLVEEGTVPEALYEQAQNRADQAYARYQQLQGQKQPSASQVSQAKTQVEQAKKQLEQARVGVEQAELQVEQANVQLNQAKEQASNDAVTAPATGEIATLTASEGDLVTNQQPFATIVSLNPMTITASVTAEQLSLFKKGEKLEVRLDSLERTVSATIQYVPSVPDDTGLYPVEATVANDDEAIKPGMMATFLLPETVVKDTLIVPTDAVVQEGDQTYVYHVVDGKAVRVDIKIQESQSDFTAIQADLPADAQLVTTGQLTLNDGGQVSIMKEDA